LIQQDSIVMLASDWRAWLIAWGLYTGLEIALHAWASSRVSRKRWPGCRPVRLTPMLMWLVSSGYAAAATFKQGMGKVERAYFIICCNRLNLWLSLAFCVGSLLLVPLDTPWATFWAALCGWRFLSRSIEITLAFARDVLRNPRVHTDRSALHRHGRLRLAMTSYLEIFLYAAAFYGALLSLVPWAETGFVMGRAVVMSLSIGTLTNVGAYVCASQGPGAWLPFVQVITTLSLVVLSLALYASRDR
jgi:hypothetical protein